MNKVFENSFAEIFDISGEIPNTIFAYWKGYLLLEEPEAVKACKFSLDYFKQENIWVMISDHKYLEGADVSFLDWLHEHYFPTAVANGLKAEIVLDSEHMMGNISLDLMYDREDLYKNVSEHQLYTPKIDTFENGKLLAKKIVEEYL